MALLSASILCMGKVVLPWTLIGEYSDSCTILELFDLMRKGKIDLGAWTFPPKLQSYVCYDVEVLKKKVGDSDRVTPNLKVRDVVSLFGRYIRFYIREEQNDESDENGNFQVEDPNVNNAKTNAFTILMNSSTKMSLPPALSEDGKIANNKRTLYNKVLNILQRAELGFTPSNFQSGQHMIQSVTNALWYIDPFTDRFNERGLYHPLLFEHLVGFNDPGKHKHKKQRIDSSSLQGHAQDLDLVLDQTWIDGLTWTPIKKSIQELSQMLHKFIEYLKKNNDKMKSNHSQSVPLRSVEDTQSIKIIAPKYVVRPTLSSRYRALTSHLDALNPYEPICVDEYTPADRYKRRYYIDNLNCSLSHKCILYRVSAGNHLGTHNFLWKIPTNHSEEERCTKNQEVIQAISKDIPKYHTRAMRRAFIQQTALICSMKPMHARNIYKTLTSDSSASENMCEKQVDERVSQAFLLQDPDIVQDLREHNQGRPPKYSVFFEKTKEYIESVVETAVDDRRHDKFTYLATAISVPDLKRQVSAVCPPNTPIPSEQWIRFQFAPKNATTQASSQYTGKLNVKFQVQSRQLRKDNVDMHYASAIFHYLKEFAVRFRENTSFICMDDKHHCKVGEPGHPVAAVERGRRVIVGQDRVFAVSDHDFTKFSIIPSVTMMIDIPDSVFGSFYRGQVYVGVKDLILEPSSPLRHITELSDILEKENNGKPILIIYMDGGPDHRLTYLSVQLCLLCLFLQGNYDMLIAARTPPMNSWKNPPERIMSILNLALQSVGLMRSQQSDEFEKKLNSLSGIGQLREYAGLSDDNKSQMMDTIEPVKVLLTKMFERLQLKDKGFKTFPPAPEQNMQNMWKNLDMYGEPPEYSRMRQADLMKSLKDRPELKAVINHCTVSRSYFFSIKKCGETDCKICRKPVLPPDVFENLHHFPDPIPGEDDHYMSFDDLYGTQTTEEHRPSLKSKQSVSPGHQIPFSPSAQTTKTVKCALVCTECEKPRVVYSAKTLSPKDAQLLLRIKQLFHYSCGSQLQELKTADNSTPQINALLEKCYVRANLSCEMAIEVPYFSSGCFPDICYYCGESDENVLLREEGAYPICSNCKNKQTTPLKRKHNMRDSQKNKKKRN